MRHFGKSSDGSEHRVEPPLYDFEARPCSDVRRDSVEVTPCLGRELNAKSHVSSEVVLPLDLSECQDLCPTLPCPAGLRRGSRLAPGDREEADSSRHPGPPIRRVR